MPVAICVPEMSVHAARKGLLFAAVNYLRLYIERFLSQKNHAREDIGPCSAGLVAGTSKQLYKKNLTLTSEKMIFPCPLQMYVVAVKFPGTHFSIRDLSSNHCWHIHTAPGQIPTVAGAKLVKQLRPQRPKK